MSIYTLHKSIPAERLDAYKNLGWQDSTYSVITGFQHIKKECNTKSPRNDTWDIKMKAPYLVQRGQIRRPLGQHTDMPLKNAVSLDYMGAAEFEFGALPSSFRRTEAQFMLYKKVKVPSIVACTGDKGKDFTLRLFANFDTTEQEAQYLGWLEQMFAGELRMKESVGVVKAAGKIVLNDHCDFWWDIENDVFMSFDKQFMSRISEHLLKSFEVLNTPTVDVSQ